MHPATITKHRLKIFAIFLASYLLNLPRGGSRLGRRVVVNEPQRRHL